MAKGFDLDKLFENMESNTTGSASGRAQSGFDLDSLFAEIPHEQMLPKLSQRSTYTAKTEAELTAPMIEFNALKKTSDDAWAYYYQKDNRLKELEDSQEQMRSEAQEEKQAQMAAARQERGYRSRREREAVIGEKNQRWLDAQNEMATLRKELYAFDNNDAAAPFRREQAYESWQLDEKRLEAESKVNDARRADYEAYCASIMPTEADTKVMEDMKQRAESSAEAAGKAWDEYQTMLAEAQEKYGALIPADVNAELESKRSEVYKLFDENQTAVDDYNYLLQSYRQPTEAELSHAEALRGKTETGYTATQQAYEDFLYQYNPIGYLQEQGYVFAGIPNAKAAEDPGEMHEAAMQKAADEYNRIVGFGTQGNVDYNKRPVISAEKMREKYPDFNAGDAATTYDIGYYVRDAAGKKYSLLVTPITEKGNILSDDDLNTYVDTLKGAEDILKADVMKLVIHAEELGSSKYWKNGQFDFEAFNDQLIPSKEAHLDAYNTYTEVTSGKTITEEMLLNRAAAAERLADEAEAAGDTQAAVMHRAHAQGLRENSYYCYTQKELADSIAALDAEVAELERIYKYNPDVYSEEYIAAAKLLPEKKAERDRMADAKAKQDAMLVIAEHDGDELGKLIEDTMEFLSTDAKTAEANVRKNHDYYRFKWESHLQKADMDAVFIGALHAELEKAGYQPSTVDNVIDTLKRTANSEAMAKMSANIDMIARKNGLSRAGLSLLSVGTNLLSGVGMLAPLENAFSNSDYRSVDPNSVYFFGANATKAMRSSVNEHNTDWGMLRIGNREYDIHDQMNNILMSSIDSFVGSLIGSELASGFGLAGGAAEWLGGSVIGVQAAGSTMQEIASRGGSSGEVLVGGLAAGLFETFFEQVSLSQLKVFTQDGFKGFGKAALKNFLKELPKGAFTNGMEEFFTEAANILFDATVLGDVSDYAARVEAYMQQIDPETGAPMTEEDAKAKVAWDLAVQVIESGVTGAIQGIFMDTMAFSRNWGRAEQIVKQANTNAAENLRGTEILKVALLSLNQESEGAKIAQKLDSELEALIGQVSEVSADSAEQEAYAQQLLQFQSDHQAEFAQLVEELMNAAATGAISNPYTLQRIQGLVSANQNSAVQSNVETEVTEAMMQKKAGLDTQNATRAAKVVALAENGMVAQFSEGAARKEMLRTLDKLGRVGREAIAAYFDVTDASKDNLIILLSERAEQRQNEYIAAEAGKASEASTAGIVTAGVSDTHLHDGQALLNDELRDEHIPVAEQLGVPSAQPATTGNITVDGLIQKAAAGEVLSRKDLETVFNTPGAIEALNQAAGHQIVAPGTVNSKSDTRKAVSEALAQLAQGKPVTASGNKVRLSTAEGIGAAETTNASSAESAIDPDVREYAKMTQEIQETTAKVYGAILRGLGINGVQIDYDENDPDGWRGFYEPKTGVIHINGYHSVAQTTDGLLWIIGHEMTHPAIEGTKGISKEAVDGILGSMKALAKAGLVRGGYADMAMNDAKLKAGVQAKYDAMCSEEIIAEGKRAGEIAGYYPREIARLNAEYLDACERGDEAAQRELIAQIGDMQDNMEAFTMDDARAELACDFVGSLLGYNKMQGDRAGSVLGTTQLLQYLLGTGHSEVVSDLGSAVKTLRSMYRDGIKQYQGRKGYAEAVKAVKLQYEELSKIAGILKSGYADRKSEQDAPSYKGRALAEDSGLYSYDFLTAQDDMIVKALPALNTVKTEGKIDREKAISLGMQNARSLGREVSEDIVAVQNRYTERELRLSATTLKHGLSGDKVSRLRTNARLAAIAGDIVQNAIPINALTNKNKQATGTYAMAALLQSGDMDVVAIVTVEQFDDAVTGIDYVDVTHAISGRLNKKGNSESATRAPESTSATLSPNGDNRSATKARALKTPTVAPTVTIADLLDIVKDTYQSLLSDDVLAHYGETKNPVGYYADKAKFSGEEADSGKQSILERYRAQQREAAKETLSKYTEAADPFNKNDPVNQKVIKANKNHGIYAGYFSDTAVYTAERMEKELKRAVYEGSADETKSFIAYVDPMSFLRSTTTSQNELNDIRTEAGKLDMEKLREQEQPIYLVADLATGEVVGHEGRHRMAALYEAGIQKVPVIIDARGIGTTVAPIQYARLKGQTWNGLSRGADFNLHNALPMNAKYADDIRKSFTNTRSEMRFSAEETPITAADIRNEKAVQRSYTRYSINEATADYARQHTGLSEQSETVLSILKELGAMQQDLNKRIKTELPEGHWRTNIHNMNEYLAKNKDIWGRLIELQERSKAAGVEVDFVTPIQDSWEIEGQTVEAGLMGFPIEYVRKEDGSYKFNGFARTLTQLYIDRMDNTARWKLQDEFISAVEDAYQKKQEMADPAPELKKMLKAVAGPVSGSQIASKTKHYAQTALRSAAKTVMALNLNSACPMFTVGNHGCYLDACYLTQMGSGGNTVNLFQSAIYAGEILQLSQETIDLLNADPDGLRVNGVGDTIGANEGALFAAFRHAAMRGLKMKIITKQVKTLELIQEAHDMGIDTSRITVQLSMDNLWIPAALDDVVGAGVRGDLQISDTLRKGNFDAAEVGYEQVFGRATKQENGTLYRKYGFTEEQVKQLRERFPGIRILPRYVVCTAQEIAELALGRGGLGNEAFIQTLMHGAVPAGCYSDYAGKVLNFGALRHVVEKNKDGVWEFYGARVSKDKATGKTKVTRQTSKAHAEVDSYIKANYTAEEQDIIYRNLQKQLCCKASENVNACAGCASLFGGGCSLCSSVKVQPGQNYTLGENMVDPLPAVYTAKEPRRFSFAEPTESERTAINDFRADAFAKWCEDNGKGLDYKMTREEAREFSERMRKATGSFYGLDGKLRVEVDDSTAVFDKSGKVRDWARKTKEHIYRWNNEGAALITEAYQLVKEVNALLPDRMWGPSGYSLLWAAQGKAGHTSKDIGLLYAGITRVAEEKLKTDMAAEGKADIEGEHSEEFHNRLMDIRTTIGQLTWVAEDIAHLLKETKLPTLRPTTLGAILDHPELYNRYPWLKDTVVKFSGAMLKEGTYGSTTSTFRGGEYLKSTITLADNSIGTLLHEIQHIIQDAAGFAPGTTKGQAGSFEKYQLAAGEIEARDTDNRKYLNAEERRETPPDIYREDALDAKGRPMGRYSAEEADTGDALTPEERNADTSFWRGVINEGKRRAGKATISKETAAARTERALERQRRSTEKERWGDALTRSETEAKLRAESIDRQAAAIEAQQKAEEKRAEREAKREAKVKAEFEKKLNRVRYRDAAVEHEQKRRAAWGGAEQLAKARKAAQQYREEARQAARDQRVMNRKAAQDALSVLRRSKLSEQVDTTNEIAEPLKTPEAVQFMKEKARFVDKAKGAAKAGYQAFVSKARAVEVFSRRQKGTRADTLFTVSNNSRATVDRIHLEQLVNRAGDGMGASMVETFLCRDEKGNIDQAKQDALQLYMLHQHNVDRMSIESRANAAAAEYLEAHPELTDYTDEELAYLLGETDEETARYDKGDPNLRASHKQMAREYLKLLRRAESVQNKAVMADDNGKVVSAETSAEIVKQFEAEYDWIKEKADGIYDWWKQFMEEWAVGQTLSQDSWALMQELYPHYVPTYRVGKKSASVGGVTTPSGISIGNVFMKAKGSTETVENIADSFARIVSNVVRTTRMNELYRNVVGEAFLDNDGDFSDLAIFDWDRYYASNPDAREAFQLMALLNGDSVEDIDTAFKANVEELTDGKGYRVTCIMEDGEAMSAWLSPDMFTALNTKDSLGKGITKLTTIANKVSGVKKAMITGYNPFFALRNVVRDFPTAVINSVSGLSFPKYYAQAWGKMTSNAAEWQQFQALGGEQTGYYGMTHTFSETVTHKDNIAKRALDSTIGKLNEALESVTRFAEYLATIDKLGDSYEGRLQGIKNAAEVTVDFSRKGEWGGFINAWVPYWNPSVQGIDKWARSIFRHEGTTGQKIAGGLMTVGRAAIMSALPELLFQAVLKATGKEDDWEKLSDRMKATYYCIPVGENKFFKLPKNREWGAVLGNPLMHLCEYANGRDDSFGTYFDIWKTVSLKPNFLPNSIPENSMLVGDLIALAKNEDFAGRAIVPSVYKSVSPEKQFTASTTAVGWALGQVASKAGIGLSPIQADYVIKNYIGDFYGMLLDMVPVGYFYGTMSADKAFDQIWQSVKNSWIGDNRYSNYYTGRYFEIMDALSQAVADDKLDDQDTYKDKQAYIWQQAITKSYGKEITDLYKQMKSVESQEENDELHTRAADLAEQAVAMYKQLMADEIDAPLLRIDYSGYDKAVQDALIEVDNFSEDYSFKPNPSPASRYTDPYSKYYEYVLTGEENKWKREKYKDIYAEEYNSVMLELVTSAAYKNASLEKKAEMLEEARKDVTPRTKSRFLDWLEAEGVESTMKE